MTPAATTLDDYRQRTATTEEYLGRVVMLSQKDTTVDHGDLKVILTDAGLGEFLPSKPADVDVFRRSCTAANRKKVATGTDGVFLNVLVRELTDDDREIARRVVIEEVDGKGKRLSYAGQIDVTFTKASSTAGWHRAPGYVDDLSQAAVDAAEGIVQSYRANRGRVNADRLRTISTDVLRKSHAVLLRSTGSVYFVPKAHCGLLERLATVAARIDGMQADSLKLIEEGAGVQRRMVQRAADADISEAASKLTAEIRDLVAGGPVSSRRARSLAKEFSRLYEQATAHEDLLEQRLDQSRVRLQQLEYAVKNIVAQAA
jgi:hypothetical protein